MSRVELDGGDWEAHIQAGMDKLFEERLGPEITEDARRYAPVGPSTPGPPAHEGGELRESISFHLNGHSLIVRADAPYALFVEMGTRPHIIRPHPRPSLSGRGQHSLHWTEGGEDIFAAVVHHPGTRAQAFLRSALFQQRD